jgi:hypothetical protein
MTEERKEQTAAAVVVVVLLFDVARVTSPLSAEKP